MARDIVFKAAYGNVDKEVVLSRLPGPYWHIYIDDYAIGQVILRGDVWDVCPQKPESLSLEDMQEIEKRITEYETALNAKKP